MTIGIVLLVAALVLFILAALGVGSPKFVLGWGGMACLTLAFLLSGAGF